MNGFLKKILSVRKNKHKFSISWKNSPNFQYYKIEGKQTLQVLGTLETLTHPSSIIYVISISFEKLF
jgi:hypothetical protein